jgi:preprotein translocase subunit SecY
VCSSDLIGNGISLIIFAGIVARVPAQTHQTILAVGKGGISVVSIIVFLIIALLVVAGVIFMTQGQRRIPVQYAKRVVGRKMYGGQSTHIPLKLNQAGVIPVIFASSVLAFPITIAQFIPSLNFLNAWFGYGTIPYILAYAILTIFFTYFYTAVSFNPVEVANNLKKYGGFIPGLRPGKPTAEYLDRVLTRITLAGALFLAFIAILPNLVSLVINIPGGSFGGTGLLIVVGVALETVKQLEAQLLMRHYEGFMK